MKKNFKKSLSVFLAVLMAVSCFSVVGFAAEVDYGAHNDHKDKVVVLEAVAATECTDGKTEGLKCTQCNVVIKEQAVIPAPHNFGEWTVAKTDNCENGYKKTRTCKNADCKKTEEETINKHSWGDDTEIGWSWVGEPANCTNSGNQTRKCSVCNIEKTRTVEALGHKWEKKKDGNRPSCKQEGAVSKYVCGRCGEVDPDRDGTTFDKLPHEDADGDGYCDNGCGGYISYDGEICTCPCHQKTGVLNTIFKIVLFFMRLFKIGQKCGCGADHYPAD